MSEGSILASAPPAPPRPFVHPARVSFHNLPAGSRRIGWPQPLVHCQQVELPQTC